MCCKNCGASLGAGAKFCSQCGAPVNAGAETKKYCRNCHSELEPGALFCPECGYRAVEIEEGPFTIGMEIGEDRTCMAVYRGGTPEMIPVSREQTPVTPALAFVETEDGVAAQWSYGWEALRDDVGDKQDGHQFLPEVFHEYTVSGGSRTVIRIWALLCKGGSVRIGRLIYTAEEIAAAYLKRQLQAAQSYLGRKPAGVVLAVPWDWLEPQKAALRRAAIRAGWKVRQIACGISMLGYGAVSRNLQKGEEKEILLCYLGPNCVEAGIFEAGGEIIEKKVSAGIRTVERMSDDERRMAQIKGLEMMVREVQREYGNPDIFKRITEVWISGEMADTSGVKERLQMLTGKAPVWLSGEAGHSYIAEGAALKGGVFDGKKTAEILPLFLDAVSSCYWVRVNGVEAGCLLNKNTTFPNARFEILEKCVKTRILEIEVLQGFQLSGKDRILAAKYQFDTGLSAFGEGMDAEVRLDMDTSGVCQVIVCVRDGYGKALAEFRTEITAKGGEDEYGVL